MASLVAQMVKAFAYNAGDPGLIPGSGRSPGEGNGNPLQYSCLENSMDKQSLVGYRPWGHKQPDMTEQLNTCLLGRLIPYYVIPLFISDNFSCFEVSFV